MCSTRKCPIVFLAALAVLLGPTLSGATSWPASVPLQDRVLPRAGEVIDHRGATPKREDVSFYYQAADGRVHIWDPASWKAQERARAKRRVTKVTGRGPSFEIEFLDVTNSTGKGFDHPSLGQARRDTVEAVFLGLSDLLAPHAGGTAEVEFQESETAGDGPLGDGGPLVACVDGFQFGFPREHIVNGRDPDEQVGQNLPDGRITIDFGHSFNDELDQPNSGEFDLASTILHEATHMLGFVSIGVDPETGEVVDCGSGSTATKTAIEFVRHLHRSSDDLQLWQATGPGGGVEFKGRPRDVEGTSAPVDYRGEPPNSPLDIFSGDLGHWADSVVVGGERPVMLTAQNIGEQRRDYLSWERQVLLDLGYSLAGSNTVAVVAGGSLAGAWLDFARQGEGFLIDVVDLGNGQVLVFVAWFTYDDQGNQQWLVAQSAALESLSFGEPIEMDIQRVTGPSFSNFDPADRVEEVWGSMTLTFENCTSASVEYDSQVGFGSGVIAIERLTGDGLAGVNCQ